MQHQKKCPSHIIHLYKYEVKVIGEFKYVLIHVSSTPNVHQIVDIIEVDIPEAYGLHKAYICLKNLMESFA